MRPVELTAVDHRRNASLSRAIQKSVSSCVISRTVPSASDIYATKVADGTVAALVPTALVAVIVQV